MDAKDLGRLAGEIVGQWDDTAWGIWNQAKARWMTEANEAEFHGLPIPAFPERPAELDGPAAGQPGSGTAAPRQSGSEPVEGLDNTHRAILRELRAAGKELLTVPRIHKAESLADLCETTVRKHVGDLIARGLARRPAGERQGVEITPRGLAAIC